MRIAIPLEERHDPAFDTIQVTLVVIKNNLEGNAKERTLCAEITCIPVAEPMPGHLIFAKNHAQKIEIPDLINYLSSKPETAYKLFSGLTDVIADLSRWKNAKLEVPDVQ